MGKKRKAAVKTSEDDVVGDKRRLPARAARETKQNEEATEPTNVKSKEQRPAKSKSSVAFKERHQSLQNDALASKQKATGVENTHTNRGDIVNNYHYALDDIILSQNDGTGEVGWQYRQHTSEAYGHNTDIEELVKAFSVGEKGEEMAPSTPPMIRSWLESPSSEHEHQRRSSTRAVNRGLRPKRGRRERTSTSERTQGKELLQKLAALYEQQDEFDTGQEIARKRTRLGEDIDIVKIDTAHSTKDQEICDNLNATSGDMFNPSQKQPSATSTQAHGSPSCLPDIPCISPIVSRTKTLTNFQRTPPGISSFSPVVKTAGSVITLDSQSSNSSPVLQRTLLSTPVSAKKRSLGLKNSPLTLKSAEQSFEELWTDEELFENDSFLALTQNISGNFRMTSPLSVPKKDRLSVGSGKSPLQKTVCSHTIGSKSTAVRTEGSSYVAKCVDTVFKTPAPILAKTSKPHVVSTLSERMSTASTKSYQKPVTTNMNRVPEEKVTKELPTGNRAHTCPANSMNSNEVISTTVSKQPPNCLVSKTFQRSSSTKPVPSVCGGANATLSNTSENPRKTLEQSSSCLPTKTSLIRPVRSNHSTSFQNSKIQNKEKSPKKTLIHQSRTLTSPLKVKSFSLRKTNQSPTKSKALDIDTGTADGSSSGFSKSASMGSTFSLPKVGTKIEPFKPKKLLDASSKGQVNKNQAKCDSANVYDSKVNTSISEDLLKSLAEPDEMLDTQAPLFDDTMTESPNKSEFQQLQTVQAKVSATRNEDGNILNTQALLDYPMDEDGDSLTEDFMATQQLFEMLDKVETTVLAEKKKETETTTCYGLKINSKVLTTTQNITTITSSTSGKGFSSGGSKHSSKNTTIFTAKPFTTPNNYTTYNTKMKRSEVSTVASSASSMNGYTAKTELRRNSPVVQALNTNMNSNTNRAYSFRSSQNVLNKATGTQKKDSMTAKENVTNFKNFDLLANGKQTMSAKENTFTANTPTTKYNSSDSEGDIKKIAGSPKRVNLTRQHNSGKTFAKFPSFDSLNTHASPKAVIDESLSSSQDSPRRKQKAKCTTNEIERKRLEALQKRKNRLKLVKR